MAERLLGFETFRDPEGSYSRAPRTPVGAEHSPFTPPYTKQDVLDTIVDTLTATTRPSPAVARGEVDLVQNPELQAIQPAAVGVVDALAAGAPAAARMAGQQAVRHGPAMVERAMSAFETSPFTPSPRLAAAPATTRAAADEWQLDTPVVGKRNIQDFYAHHGVTPHEDIVRSATSRKDLTGQDLLEAHATREQLMTEIAHNPKPIAEMTPDELTAYGELHGVNLGLTPVQTVKDPETGRDWLLPGGLDEPLSLTDAYWLKSQAYDPNEMSPSFQAALQQKLTAATTPAKPDARFEMFNRAMFGMQSPNTPLLTNQFMTSRMRVRNDNELNELASMIDWKPGEKVSAARRRAADKAIGERFGIQAGAAGGMGMRSSADLTNVAEMAQLYRDNPQFFQKKPEHTWQQHAERLIAVQRGLAPKTGSFGAVWEAPGEATTSAMDRHMARNFRPAVMADPDLGPGIRKDRVKLWNEQLKRVNQLKRKKNLTKLEKEFLKTAPPAGSTRVKSYDEIMAQEGGDDWDLGRIVIDATKHSEPKYRLASGKINPAVPEHLRDLPLEPEKVTVFGPIYTRMLEENARLAQEQGLNVFAEQWRVWDRLRKTIEPHEAMHRDVPKLPRMAASELSQAYGTQKAAGFGQTFNPVTGKRYAKPFPFQRGMAWGLGLGVGLPAMTLTGPQSDNQM